MTNQVMTNILILARALRNTLLSNDKDFEKSQIELIANTRKNSTEVIEKLKPMIHSEKGKYLLGKMIESRDKYSAGLDYVLPLVDSSSGHRDVEKATHTCCTNTPRLPTTISHKLKIYPISRKKNPRREAKNR